MNKCHPLHRGRRLLLRSSMNTTQKISSSASPASTAAPAASSAISRLSRPVFSTSTLPSRARALVRFLRRLQHSLDLLRGCSRFSPGHPAGNSAHHRHRGKLLSLRPRATVSKIDASSRANAPYGGAIFASMARNTFETDAQGFRLDHPRRNPADARGRGWNTSSTSASCDKVPESMREHAPPRSKIVRIPRFAFANPFRCRRARPTSTPSIEPPTPVPHSSPPLSAPRKQASPHASQRIPNPPQANRQHPAVRCEL